jgi:hypothetical protein
MNIGTLAVVGALLYLWNKNQGPQSPVCYPSTFVGPLPPGTSYCQSVAAGVPNVNPTVGVTSLTQGVVQGVVPQTQPGASQSAVESQPGYSNNPTFPDNQYY